MRIPAIEKYAYCLCLHVKPTTIFIAVFKLIRALLFASILLNTEFSVNEQVNELSGVDERHKSTAIALNIFSRIVMASVSAVGIYAVISGRAALLMPLYAMLLVDFFFALPAFYNRDLDPSLTDNMTEFRNYHAGNQYARYSLMFVSTISMIFKIYFLCVIWKCYRYLRLIELVSPLRLSEIYPHPHYPIVRALNPDATDLANSISMAPPPYDSITSNMKPPNYEEAMKTSTAGCPTVAAINTTSVPQQTVVLTSLQTEQNHGLTTQVVADILVRSPTVDNNISETVTNNHIDNNQGSEIPTSTSSATPNVTNPVHRVQDITTSSSATVILPNNSHPENINSQSRITPVVSRGDEVSVNIPKVEINETQTKY